MKEALRSGKRTGADSSHQSPCRLALQLTLPTQGRRHDQIQALLQKIVVGCKVHKRKHYSHFSHFTGPLEHLKQPLRDVVERQAISVLGILRRVHPRFSQCVVECGEYLDWIRQILFSKARPPWLASGLLAMRSRARVECVSRSIDRTVGEPPRVTWVTAV